ncbi:MAG: HRDC domain-containing protein [Candidatus Delongbacteria bacterium]|nr:HRDC domain-containing protein [Candidatus Delongbacteria bacterium]MCG2759797.1 HRDC domain-containing protein [Candidatus Delongbacteria bacterium]
MQLKVFTIPILNSEPFETEMNHFFATHKVIDVRKEFSQSEKGVYWCFCAEYIESGAKGSSDKSRNKIDYKAVLSENQFKVFSRMREIRKIIAAGEALPAYAVFTDEELSNISKLEEISLSKLKTIEGIGEKKIEKFGQRLLESLKENTQSEKNGQPDKLNSGEWSQTDYQRHVIPLIS